MLPQAPLNPGDSFFQGPFICSHCQGSHAQRGRFALYDAKSKEKNDNLTFCTPECAAGYNWHVCTDVERRARHFMLEERHLRRIQPAPPYHTLRDLSRETWLEHARLDLTRQEWERVKGESVIK